MEDKQKRIMNNRIKNKLKRVVALVLVLIMVLTSANLPLMVSILAADSGKTPLYEKLAYTFDIKVNLTGDYANMDSDKIPVTVYCGDEEKLSRNMEIDGNVGLIKGIPIYIDAGTGNMTNGGDGTYQTNKDFYVIGFPYGSEDSMFKYILSSPISATNSDANQDENFTKINLTKDKNDLVWEATSIANVNVKMREVKDYDTTVYVYGNDITEAKIISYLKECVELMYKDEGADQYTYVKPSQVKSLGNSKYQIKFVNIPYSEIINDTVDYIYGDIPNFIKGSTGGVTGYCQKTSISGTLIWQDVSNESLRPEEDTIKSIIKVYRTENNSALVYLDADQIEINNKGNTWDITINDLPLYSETGMALNYYYTFGDSIEANEAVEYPHIYRIRYDNGTNGASAVVAYSGANIYLSLGNPTKKPAVYSIDIVWKDDEYNQAREDEIADDSVILYLWRKTGSESETDISPVCDENGNQYVYALDTDKIQDGINTITLEEDFKAKNLPVYNESGVRYIYYISMQDKNNAYEVRYSDPSHNYASDKDTINLVRVGKENIVSYVYWNASGENDYVGISSELVLQRRLKNSTKAWENVTSVKTDKTTTYKSTFRNLIYNVDKYTEDGKTYEFRIIEKSITDSSSKVLSITGWGNNSDANTDFVHNGYSYHAVAKYDQDVYTITNTLFGYADFNTKVTWNYKTSDDAVKKEFKELLQQKLEEGKNCSYTLLQNGEVYRIFEIIPAVEDKYYYQVKDAEGIVLETKEITVTDDKVNEIITWNLGNVIIPKYDDYGKKYSYTLTEKDHADVNTIIKVSSSISVNAKDYKAVVSHSYSGGTPHYVYTQKKWSDTRTDIAKRSAEIHLVALEKREDGEYYLIRDFGADSEGCDNSGKSGYYKATLNFANDFTAYVRYSPVESLEAEYGSRLRYAVVEYSVSYEDGETYTSTTGFENYKVNDKVDKGYLFNVADSEIKSSVVYDEAKKEIGLYAYQSVAGISESNLNTTTKTTSSTVFTNSILPITLDLTVSVNWSDSSNISGYRKDKLLLELYRSVNEVPEKVDEYIWNTPKPITNSYTAYTFKDLPMHDKNGAVYNYTVKQYIVDNLGNKVLIDETATESTTKSHYITVLDTGTDTFSNKDGIFKYNKNYTISNSARNVEYNADFYIVWHDEYAYFDNARPDMSYKLYYNTEGDTELKEYNLSEYKLIIKTADTGNNNPFYQVAEYTNIREFDSEGNKINYYLKATKTPHSNSVYNYVINYYDISNSEVTMGDKVEDKGYSHRDISDSASIIGSIAPDNTETGTCYVAQDGVISNSIIASLYVSGIKKWVNVSDNAVKPDCSIYLFRSSKHDSTTKKPESRLDEELIEKLESPKAYVDKVKLNDFKSGYSFNDENGKLKAYDKYDKYGANYEYNIVEAIFAADNSIIQCDIMEGNAESNQLLVNYYDPYNKNRRDITIEKRWYAAGEFGDSIDKNPPVAKFYVYRMEYTKMKDDKIVHAKDVDLMDTTEGFVAPYDSYLKSKAELVDTVYIQYNVANKGDAGYDSKTLSGLNIYAPNGYPYVYYVVEDTNYVKSYSVDNVEVSSQWRKLEDNVIVVSNEDVDLESADNKKSVEFKNTLLETKFNVVKGTMTWNEGDTNIRSEQRPDVDMGDISSQIKLRLTRSAVTQKEYSTLNTVGNIIVFDQANEASYPLPVGTSVEWKLSDKDSNIWEYTITIPDGILMYSENGNPYTYIVTETLAGNTGSNYGVSVNNRSNTTDKVADDVLTIPSALVNRLKGTFEVQKYWMDGYDSYGLRPSKVMVMFQYKDGTDWKVLTYAAGKNAGKIITREISREGSWKSSLTQFPIIDGTDAYAYRAIEVAIGYTQPEGEGTKTTWLNVAGDEFDLSSYNATLKTLDMPSALAANNNIWDYSPSGMYGYKWDVDYLDNTAYKSDNTFGSYRVFPADPAGINNKNETKKCSITNTLDDGQSVVLEVEKVWKDDNDAFGVRPTLLTLMLQKKVVGETEWNDVTKITIGATHASPLNPNVWKHTFSNLPKTDEFGAKIAYRAIELSNVDLLDSDAPGTIRVGNYTQTDSDYGPKDEPVVDSGVTTYTSNFENTLSTKKSITVDKDWIIEGGDAKAAESKYVSNVELRLTYEDGTVYDSKIALKDGEYKYTWENIPMYSYKTVIDEVTGDAVPVFSALKNYELKETSVNLGGDDIAVTYKDKTNQQGSFVNGTDKWMTKISSTSLVDNESFNITNTPLTYHELKVSYKGDMEDKYSTRPKLASIGLQYRYKGEDTWNNADTTLTAAMLSGTEVAKKGLASNALEYGYTFTDLPKYMKDDTDIKECEYRIVENKVDSLNVLYEDELANSLLIKELESTNDRTAGGYSYKYAQSLEGYTTEIEKELYKVSLKGNKVWDDQKDIYKGRVKGIDGVQSSSSTVKVAVYKNGTLVNTDIEWSSTDKDTWVYNTEAVLPKYKSVSNTLESYTVKETSTINGYTVKYASGTAAAYDSITKVEAGNEKVYPILDITNQYNTVNLGVKKVWEDKALCDKLGYSQVSVKYLIQKSTDGINYSNMVYTDSDEKEQNVEITLTYDASGVTTGEVSKLPKQDTAGKNYTYRIIETQLILDYEGTMVTYDLSHVGSEYVVTQTIGDKALEFARFEDSVIAKNSSYTYDFGPMKATYSLSSNVYQFKNTANTATAKVALSFKENKTTDATGAANNAILVKNFRPDSVMYVLMRRATVVNATPSGDWTDVTEEILGTTTVTESITKDKHVYTSTIADKLPVYNISGGNMVKYEYRVVEKQFSFTDGINTSRLLRYAVEDYKSNTIASDFTDNKLLCDDYGVESKVFYAGSQTNSVSGNVFTTTIVNRLSTEELAKEVWMTLSGKISWIDNSDELGKRPDEEGLDMVLLVSKSDNTSVEIEFNIGKQASADFATKIAGVTPKIECIKNTDNTWSYTITKLPLYDETGNYLTYSICHKKDATDYIGKAAVGEANQKADEKLKYASGTMTDIKNQYDVDGKQIIAVDFVENMVTQVTVEKTWIDNNNLYIVRPEKLNCSLQSREVTKTGDKITGNTEWTQIERVEIEPLASEKGTNIWNYTYEDLPQYKEDGETLLQYRIVEIGKDKDDNEVLMDKVSSEIEENGFVTNETAHIGSYYMTVYEVEWDNGYNHVSISNTLDKREDITVVKSWNAPKEKWGDAVNITMKGVVHHLVGSTMVDTDADVFTNDLNESNDWKVTYTGLPKYDNNFKPIEWSVLENSILIDGKTVQFKTKELQSDSDTLVSITEDNKWEGTYKQKYSTANGALNDILIFTITNTPTVNAKLSVKYVDDFSNNYATRFDTAKAQLQYRVEGESEWNKVDMSGDANAKTIAAMLCNNTNQPVITNTAASMAEYEYSYTNLPEYIKNSSGTLLQVEYRIVETLQQKESNEATVGYENIKIASLKDAKLTALANGDRVSGGYEYAYDYTDTQSDAVLSKTLAKTTLSGNKNWVDEDNAYNTRPLITANGGYVKDYGYRQSADSVVRITVAEEDISASKLLQPFVHWNQSATDENVWEYETTKLPKYKALTNTAAKYTITEECTDLQYKVSYAKNDTDIINTLDSINLEAIKVWYNDSQNEAASDLTFRLQRKIAEGEFEDVDSSYCTKTLKKGEDKVVWTNLPTKTYDGKTITYQIIEDTKLEGYYLETKHSVDVENNKDIYTFYNIKTMEYTVNKTWKDTTSAIMPVGLKYTSKGILQRKIAGEEWKIATNTSKEEQNWSFESTYEETQVENNKKSVTFTNLPMYTTEGEKISYRGLETEVNSVAADTQTEYAIKYDHKENVTNITNSLKVVRFLIHKKDAVNGAVLDKVSFEMYEVTLSGEKYVRVSDTPAYSGVTDKNGELMFYIPKTTTYELVEISGQSGYVVDYSEIITLTEADLHTTKDCYINNERKLGKLVIYKLDPQSKEALDGVTYALYKKNDGSVFEKIWNFITGNTYTVLSKTGVATDGVTTIDEIPWGEYYIVEEKAVDGYTISTKKYYFTVDAITVENDIELIADAAGNKLYNYKNKLSFMKTSVTDMVLHGGEYSILKADGKGGYETAAFYLSADATGERLTQFSIPEKENTVSIYGLASGEYVIRELKAPEGYAIAEDVTFFITDKGEIRKGKDKAEWTDATVIMKDMPLYSFTFIKEWEEDENWVNTFRPEKLQIQLYQYRVSEGIGTRKPCGSLITLNINKVDKEYTYTYTDLPKYEVVKDKLYELAYVAYEIEQDSWIYTATPSNATATASNAVPSKSVTANAEGAGTLYEQTVRNIAPASQKLTIEKININGPEKVEFNVSIKIGKTEESLTPYVDYYWINGEKMVMSEGLTKLKGGESLQINVPEGCVCRVEELLEASDLPEYATEYIVNGKTDDTAIKYVLYKVTDETDQKITIKNTKKIYTAIENKTEKDSKTEGDVSLKYGGKIGIIEKNDDTHSVVEDSFEKVVYKEGKYGVYWHVDKYWVCDNNFEVTYKESTGDIKGDEIKIIKVSNYLDAEGNVKPVDDPCYDELRSRYVNFEIEKIPGSDMIVLYLSDTQKGLPYLNTVTVKFFPTIAVANMTADYVGGKVKVEGGKYQVNSDGMGENKDSRYVNETAVYASADEGYYVDINNIIIGAAGSLGNKNETQNNNSAGIFSIRLLANTSEKEPVKLNSDNTFDVEITYRSGEKSTKYNAAGKVSILDTDEEGRPVQLKLVLNKLEMPTDIGFKFIKAEKKPEPTKTPVPTTEVPKTSEAPATTEVPKTSESPVTTEVPKTTEVPASTITPTTQQDDDDDDDENYSSKTFYPVTTEVPASTVIPTVTETTSVPTTTLEDNTKEGYSKEGEDVDTGDNNGLEIWLCLTIASLMGLLGTLFVAKKKEE